MRPFSTTGKLRPLFLSLCVLRISAVHSQPVEDRVVLDGGLTSRYVLRATEGAVDNDLTQDLGLDLWSGQKVHLRFFGTLEADLDGGQSKAGFYPLEDLADAYPSPVLGTVYEAYAELSEPFWMVRLARAGRQASSREEAVRFDGLSMEVAPGTIVAVTVYGGIAEHFHEIDAPWGSDYLAGGGLDFLPGDNTRVTLDYLYTHDRRDLPLDRDQDDQLLAIGLWQRFASVMKTTARFRMIDLAAQDLRIRSMAVFQGLGLELDAGYEVQFGAAEERSNELSSYYDILGTVEPFQTFTAKVRYLANQLWAFEVGGRVRNLIAPSTEGPFNRQYGRLFAATEVRDLPARNLTLTVTGETWWSEDGNTYSVGLDASYSFDRAGRKGSIGVGSYFSLYNYDTSLAEGERQDTRNTYVAARFPVGASMSIDGRYELELGAETFQSARLGVRYEF